MRLKEIYDFLIAEGIREDLRTKKEITAAYASAKARYQKLAPFEKKFFDRESLKNPYADSRLIHGNPDKPIRRILVGIDIGVAEVLLADRLREKGEAIDLIIAHHPVGLALAGLYDVMNLQVHWLKHFGLDEKIARILMDKRIQEVERGVHSANHERTADVARTLDIPLLCCHTPADNHVAHYLQKIMETQKPQTLKDVVALLLKEPEYQSAAQLTAGPKIVVGKSEDKAGKIMIDMTGGTEGSQDVFARLSQAGLKTIIGMHMSDKHFNKVKNEHLNVIIAGHIASDNIGLNLILDKLLKKDKNLDVCACSGFKRVCRSWA